MNFCLAALDNQAKKEPDTQFIAIIFCKTKNRLTIGYVMNANERAGAFDA